jgi:hypothetical protein
MTRGHGAAGGGLILLGVWLIAQVTVGHMLERLGIVSS